MYFEKYKTDKEKLEAVAAKSSNIMYIYNPSENLQIMAISVSPYVCKYIANLTYAAKTLALYLDGSTISYIHDTDDSLQLAALIRREFWCINIILNEITHPTDRAIDYILDCIVSKGNTSSVRHNNDIIYAIHRDLGDLPDNLKSKLDKLISFGYVSKDIYKKHKDLNKFRPKKQNNVKTAYVPKDITHDELVKAIAENPGLIEFIENPSDDLLLVAVKSWPSLVERFLDLPEEVQLIAVKKRPELIANIKRPADSVVRYIIENCKKDIIQTMNVDFDKLPDDLKLILELRF